VQKCLMWGLYRVLLARRLDKSSTQMNHDKLAYQHNRIMHKQSEHRSSCACAAWSRNFYHISLFLLFHCLPSKVNALWHGVLGHVHCSLLFLSHYCSFIPTRHKSSTTHLIIGYEHYFAWRIFGGLELIVSFFSCQLHAKAILEAILTSDSCITPSPHSHPNDKPWREERIHHPAHRLDILCLLRHHLRLRHHATLNATHI
jgi:hypothetical protein